ncbi:hypothetical protein [Collimonas sp.]|uniref:hypothetical protein n=1 Tax=Collimonas sp. TaxID=1963772 RepID=UPI002C24E2D8|nr:hypothetical protein [Collimonas sp.]HWW05875.1 hypothetical protein [Collimonas sp.]
MESKLCPGCGESFQPRSQTPNQYYCSKEACQRERRRLWQQQKRQSDPDYYDNQMRAQHAWIERNPGYWRQYRILHPNYVKRNRVKQSRRHAKRKKEMIAKMDASILGFPLSSGIYRLITLGEPKIAKMDAWTVELTLIIAT